MPIGEKSALEKMWTRNAEISLSERLFSVYRATKPQNFRLRRAEAQKSEFILRRKFLRLKNRAKKLKINTD